MLLRSPPSAPGRSGRAQVAFLSLNRVGRGVPLLLAVPHHFAFRLHSACIAFVERIEYGSGCCAVRRKSDYLITGCDELLPPRGELLARNVIHNRGLWVRMVEGAGIRALSRAPRRSVRLSGLAHPHRAEDRTSLRADGPTWGEPGCTLVKLPSFLRFELLRFSHITTACLSCLNPLMRARAFARCSDTRSSTRPRRPCRTPESARFA